jgi:hypothetical protein
MWCTGARCPAGICWSDVCSPQNDLWTFSLVQAYFKLLESGLKLRHSIVLIIIGQSHWCKPKANSTQLIFISWQNVELVTANTLIVKCKQGWNTMQWEIDRSFVACMRSDSDKGCHSMIAFSYISCATIGQSMQAMKLLFIWHRQNVFVIYNLL